MARAVVRYSLQADKGSVFTNQIRTTLERAGFERIGTAALECRRSDLVKLTTAIGAAMQIIVSAAPAVTLDHVWVYIDEADES